VLMQAIRAKLIVLLAALFCVVSPSAKGKDGPPLIPREDLFGDPEKAAAKVSPDGRWLAWLAPVHGVLNDPPMQPDAAWVCRRVEQAPLALEGASYQLPSRDHHLRYPQAWISI